MSPQILRLNNAGLPVDWLSWQDAVCLHARDMVSWSYGETVMLVRGGLSRLTNTRTILPLNSVIACRGKVMASNRSEPPLSNRALFRRDQHTCLYCGKQFPGYLLSRDHVHPLSRGGRDSWMNVVTAFKRCNARKGNSMLTSAGMQLLALPFVPNHAEYLALTHSARIRGDQILFLKNQFSGHRRMRDFESI
ncbi:MAG: HNH endonuclease [Gammaproteobacteria bacterium]|nr:HNH endonuclease [Gammaproteobacteria bacterium]